jgi:peptidoglycan/LPS O-acetylase OafA/YrhL
VIAKNNAVRGHSFVTLDALRGVAALAVLQFHVTQAFGVAFFPHGYLAVDLFFILSGFVLTHAYQEKLDNGWSTLAFLKVRLIRLYPLYLVGLLLGGSFFVLEGRFGKTHLSGDIVAKLFVCGVLFVPSVVDLPNDMSAFPFNVPSWSLFGEVVANIFHSVFLRRRSSWFLSVVAFSIGVLTLYHVLATGDLGGLGWARLGIFYSVGRVLYSYIVGILLYRLWKTGKVRVRLSGTYICLLLLGLLAIRNAQSIQLGVDLIIVVFIFPLMLLLGATAQAPPRLARIFRILGGLSYAIYVLHLPLWHYFDVVWIRVIGGIPDHFAPWPGLLYGVTCCVVASCANRFYDTPVRQAINKLFGPHHAGSMKQGKDYTARRVFSD